MEHCLRRTELHVGRQAQGAPSPSPSLAISCGPTPGVRDDIPCSIVIAAGWSAPFPLLAFHAAARHVTKAAKQATSGKRWLVLAPHRPLPGFSGHLFHSRRSSPVLPPSVLLHRLARRIGMGEVPLHNGRHGVALLVGARGGGASVPTVSSLAYTFRISISTS